jgi:hypothetical protein
MTIIVLHPRTDTQNTAAKMSIHWKKNGILIFCTNVSRGNFVLRLQEAVFSAWKLRALDWLRELPVQYDTFPYQISTCFKQMKSLFSLSNYIWTHSKTNIKNKTLR